jgi:hypothetical protein
MLAFNMESKLVKLKSDFNNIITIRNSVKNIFDILQIRIDKLKVFYSEFIKNNKTEMFVFGLDSFHFQSKLIDIEYDDMKRLFMAINNRMYCEYFKLNKIIIDYILTNVNDKKITELIKVTNYPVYKDLEPYKEYKFEIILEIHENILNLLAIMVSQLNNKENELSIHITKKNIGLNIDNFITSFTYNIVVMREKILMFINYIEFFHTLHTKYLKRFSNKIQLMYSNINNDIKFDDSIEINKNKRKELIDEFSVNNVDNKLLKEIKKSVGSETSSSDSEHDENNNILISNSNTPTSIISDSIVSNNSEHSNNSDNSNNTVNTISSYILSSLKIPSLTSESLAKNKNKKNIKEIIKKNVNKVFNLQLCKQKEENILNQSDEQVETLFFEIENSCNNIIEKDENIKILFNPLDDKTKINKPLNIKPLLHPDDLLENNEIIEETREIIEETREIIEEKQEPEEKEEIIEEKQEPSEEKQELSEETNNHSDSNYTSENDNIEKEPPKKKRAYNRKKK